MNLLLTGILLILLGLALLFIDRQRRSRSNRTTVSATHGSVAVGGDSNAPIINTSTVGNSHHGGHWLQIAGIISELGGIAAVIWHATHLGTK